MCDWCPNHQDTLLISNTAQHHTTRNNTQHAPRKTHCAERRTQYKTQHHATRSTSGGMMSAYAPHPLPSLLLLLACVSLAACAAANSEHVLLWGDKVERTGSGFGVVGVQRGVVSLDSFVEYNKVPQSLHLPEGIKSVQIILSTTDTTGDETPFFPVHSPSTQLYVKYQPNFTKKLVNHTILATFISSLLPELPKLNTTKMAAVREDVIPVSKKYLSVDPFTASGPLAGYLRAPPPSEKLYNRESIFSEQSGARSFLSKFFGFSGETLKPYTDWTSTHIELSISLHESNQDKYHFTFLEAGLFKGGRAISFPPRQSNVKHTVYVPSTQPTKNHYMYETADGQLTERSVRVDSVNWKVDVSRSIDKQGFHRDINTQITIGAVEGSHKSCSVILLEYFSNDVYVDYDQMYEYEKFGGPPFVLFEHIDVEVTAFNPVASHFLLFVKKPFMSENQAVTVNISVPVHMRYQTPQLETPTLPVRFNSPQVYIQCDGSFATGKTTFRATQFPYVDGKHAARGVTMKEENKDELIVHVPAGKLEDTGIVAIGTVVATWVATIFILLEIFWKSRKSPDVKKQK